MQYHISTESIGTNVCVKSVSQFCFSHYVIEVFPNCYQPTKPYCFVRFKKGNDQLTVVIYQTHYAGLNNVIQVTI